jgi:hypothetical protein
LIPNLAYTRGTAKVYSFLSSEWSISFVPYRSLKPFSSSHALLWTFL